MVPVCMSSCPSAFTPMSPKIQAELKACEYHLMAGMFDRYLQSSQPLLRPRSVKAQKNVELLEVNLQMTVGRINFSYSRRSFRCSPGVWFLTILLRPLHRS